MGVRHLVVVMSLLVLSIAYITRVDLSNAIVEMTNTNSTSNARTYAWSETIKGNLLVMMFMGYFWLQLPAGYLSDIYGARNITSLALLIIALTKYLTPISAQLFDYFGIAACRFVEGLAQGALLPATASIMVRWLPPGERVIFNQLIFGGIPLGSTLGLFCSGFLLSTQIGWPLLYYVEAVVCTVFTIMWHFLVSSSPDNHPFIGDNEKQMISESTSKGSVKDKQNLKVPWLSLLTSLPVIALMATHTARNYGYWTFFTQSPRYISGVAKLDIKSTGMYTALPNLCACVTVIIFTFVNLALQKSGIISLTIRRKMWITIALGGQGTALLVLAIFKPTTVELIILMLCLAASTNVAIYSGTLANQIDLSPNFGGILMALTTLCGSFSGIVAPSVVSLLVSDKSSTTQWGNVFIVGAAISLLGNLLYLLVGSAQIQPWNDPNYKASEAATD